MTDVRGKMVKGTFWALLERFSVQFVSFGVTMVLSRILTPTDYGTVALLGIFMMIAGTLVDSGFGSALVQKKDATELDFNSVFYLSLSLSLIAYASMFVTAPLIANLYKTPDLIWITRIAALQLVFSAVNSVQNAELARKMLFHLSFRISLISTFTSGVVGVVCALNGCGVWALVWQGFSGGFIGVFSRWYIIAWHPRLMFSWGSLKELFSFGWKMVVNSFADSAYDNIYGLIVGKFYSKADLAYINKGRALPNLIMSTVNGTLGRVTFPALVQFQNDIGKIRSATRRIIQCSCFIIFPLMMGSAACAYDLIILLFGAQWQFAVPYAQMGCFQLGLWPLSLVQLTLVAIGRSDVLLKMNLIRKVLGFTIMFSTIWISPIVFMAATAFVNTPIATWINTWPNKKMFGYTFWDEMRDVRPIALATIVMAGLIWMMDWCLRSLGLSGDANAVLFLRLLIKFLLGVVVYFSLALFLRIPAFAELLRVFSPKVSDRIPFVRCLSHAILDRIDCKEQRIEEKKS